MHIVCEVDGGFETVSHPDSDVSALIVADLFGGVRFFSYDPATVPHSDQRFWIVDFDAETITTNQAQTDAANLIIETRNLTRSEFAGLLGRTELDLVWDGLVSHYRGQTDAASLDIKQLLAENRAKSSFRLNETLAIVAQFRPLIASTIAPMVDVSDTAIIAAWREIVRRADSL